MYMWVYLFFFNMLWVWIPFWILYECYSNLVGNAGKQSSGKTSKKRK